MSRKDFDRLTNTIGCIVCRREFGLFTPAAIHHLTGIKYRSTGKKASDDHAIPLCHAHHQGSFGIHHLGAKVWEQMFGSQDELLAECREILGRLH